MCGITGIVVPESRIPERESLVGQMLQTLLHRGPDAQSVASIGPATFGVARLSIVDRVAGEQPMSLSHEERRGLIAYNGEVYNFESLRSEYENHGVTFHNRSDTEAVLAAHLVSGIDAVKKLDGMFAYAMWTEPEGQLLLVRDRLGIKPLFYCDLGDALIFASEPKALFAHPRLQRRPNFTAILEYFLHGAAFAAGYTTADRSFFDGVKALPPGHLLTWSPEAGISQRKYWSPLDEFTTLRSDEKEAEHELRETMSASVRSMLMGEVPIGTALSGGLDSSLITAEATRAMNEQLVSACITYRADAADNDARHAALVSDALNREMPGSHRLEYTYLREESYLDSLDEMITAFDEPHWEPRQLAMFENYRTLARFKRTVVLTGEGADEFFFGYYQKFPGFRTSAFSGPAQFAELWRERLPEVEALLSPAFASGLVSNDLANHLIDSSIASYLTPTWNATGDRLRAVQSWYLHTFLPWLLMDNDRCSMAHSLEGRFPFLSNDVISLALQLPPTWNIPKDGSSSEKVLLRRAASHSLPVEIWRDREKSPLPVPDATSYAGIIVQRLEVEIEKASSEVWGILNRTHVLSRIAQFKDLMLGSGVASGQTLTSYIALGAKPRVRTAELFGILTFLRWYDLFVASPRKDSSCYSLKDQTTRSTIESQFQPIG